MTVAATVIVPTHDHGPTLEFSLATALAQTVRDLDVVVIGDGVPDEARVLVRELAAGDGRIRFLDHPKGPSRGEAYRHEALGAVDSPVLYLSDDDLWLPDHAERLLGLLETADFAHALSTWLLPDGTAQATVLDLSVPFHREAVIEGRQTPSLSVTGHTLDAYRRLPHGWRTTPEDVHTDSWMWRQFLAEDWVRAASGRVPTVVHLPSPARRDWPLEKRLEELERYERAIADPGWRVGYVEAVLEKIVEEDAWFWAHADSLQRWGEGLEAQLREIWDDRARVYGVLEQAQAELAAERARRER